MGDSSKGISLNAATAVGLGSVIHLGVPREHHTMQVTWTSNPTAVKVYLWGSNDGTNFGTVPLAVFDSTVGPLASGDLVSVSDANVTHVLAEIVTLTGGSTPAVTATIASR